MEDSMDEPTQKFRQMTAERLIAQFKKRRMHGSYAETIARRT